MGGLLDAFQDFFEDTWDALTGVVDDLWAAVVAPLAEFIFNALGFEDETVVNAYVAVSSVYGSEAYVNPFHKIPINRVMYETEVYDEIMNIYIAGEHVRIKSYIRKVERYNNMPINTHVVNTINRAGIKAIIEADIGETIELVSARTGMPTTELYIESWLTDNEATHGYTYVNSQKRLIDSSNQTFVLHPSGMWTWDPINLAYDINLLERRFFLEQENALNILAAPASSYAVAHVGGTALNVLAAPVSTYGVLGTVVTVDTAVDNSVPTVDAGGDSLTMDTAIDNTVPTLNLDVYAFTTEEYESTVQELVPQNASASRGWEAIYTVDSDTAEPPIKHWWFYAYEPDPTTYPQLYPTDPVFPADRKQEVLPITPLKVNSQWLLDLDNTAWEESNRSLRRYGIEARKFTNRLKEDPNGNNASITSVFMMFGINIATASSQSEIDYLYVMFADYATIESDLDVTAYLQMKDDITFARLWDDNNTWVGHIWGGGSRDSAEDPHWTLGYTTDRDRIMSLFIAFMDPRFQEYEDLWDLYEIEYAADPLSIATEDAARLVANWQRTYSTRGVSGSSNMYPADLDFIAQYLEELVDTIEAELSASTTTYNISHDDYNLTIGYASVATTVLAGDIGDGTVGNVEKQVVATDYQLYLRKQTAINEITEIRVLDLTAFTYIRKDASNVYMAAMDFVGSDSGGLNVRNNMVIPVTYGYLLDLGIIRRKEALYRALQFNMYFIDVTELRYYETAAFANFIGIVLKVVAVVVLVISLGSASTSAQALWTAAKFYGTKIIAEYAIQQILLSNPNSKFAQVLAFGVALYAASAGGEFNIGINIDTALETINAVNQVTTVYTQIQSEKLIQESIEFVENAKERDERLQQAIDNYDFGSASLLDYIKETITMKYTTSESFYNEKLTRSLVDQAIDMDQFVDMEKFLDLDQIKNETI